MAQPKTNAMRILEKEKIPYEMFTYPVTEEHQDGVTTSVLAHDAIAAIAKNEKKIFFMLNRFLVNNYCL